MQRNGHPSPAISKVVTEYTDGKKMMSPAFPHLELLKREESYPNDSPHLELIIGHSHSHWDHTAGDSELRNFKTPSISKTNLIPASNVTAIMNAYSINSWPESLGELDLGGRVLDIIPIPGHTTDSIAIYDRETGLLLTGDSIYPGRLFVPRSDILTFKASHSRLEKFVEGQNVSWILGCHVEQKKTPFEEYPLGTIWQPDEHILQFPVRILGEVRKALKGVDEETQPGQIMFEEFSIVVQ